MKRIQDMYGSIEIQSGAKWGANTQRSLINFPIGVEKMPIDLIRAMIALKKAAAQANKEAQVLDSQKADAIMEACRTLLSDLTHDDFPLSIWQTGSGTQTNMNVNEVIAHVANQLSLDIQVHPNDDVNRGQSSNDVFPSSMHMCSVHMLKRDLLPILHEMKTTLETLSSTYAHVIKIGRTHLQDATPITFGQEASAWTHMFDQAICQIEATFSSLYTLAIGGTAVGTGLNTYEGFGEDVCRILNEEYGESFLASENPFHAMSSKDALVFAHGALNALASNALKFANDIRWLASGPRCGLGEINLPSNEAGSSIMPGKVNPTQCEALSMVCVQVMANHMAITIGASQGNFQLNTYMPLIAYNMCQSIQLLSDAFRSFHLRCLQGITINETKMASNLESSLMSATFLNGVFGYDITSQLVKQAYLSNASIKDVVTNQGLMKEDEFDELFDYRKMIASYKLR